MIVNAYASLPHYAQHIEPIVQALRREGVFGEFWSPRSVNPWGTPLPVDLSARRDPVIVASHTDAVRMSHARRPLIYVEHGAGQTYVGVDRGAGSSYSGGDHDHLNVVLYVCPNVNVAARWQARYPDRATVVAGCPRMDRWHSANLVTRNADRRVVAWAWHWEGQACPETLSALGHYLTRIGACVAAWRAQGWNVVGHGHPRNETFLRHLWASHGVEWWEASRIFDEAAVLVADNTSLLYEFASLDRGVVTLSAPWYRRDVEHGLRFWSHIPGIEVTDPAMLERVRLDVIANDDLPIVEKRRAVVADVYAHADGKASTRAAEAIADVVGRL